MDTKEHPQRRVLLDATDAARELGSTAARVRRWAKQGLIAHVELPNGDIRFRRLDLEAFAARHVIDVGDQP